MFAQGVFFGRVFFSAVEGQLSSCFQLLEFFIQFLRRLIKQAPWRRFLCPALSFSFSLLEVGLQLLFGSPASLISYRLLEARVVAG